MKIFIFFELNAAQLSRLRQIAGNDKLCFPVAQQDAANIDPGFADCAVAFGNVPAAWLAQTTALRWIQLESAGFEEYRSLDWRTLGEQITLTNLAGFFSEPVAQSILAGILSHYRGIEQLVLSKSAKNWMGGSLRKQLRSLSGATVVLLGRGSINIRLAELLGPCRCNIISFGSDWDRTPLDQSLAIADIVVCAMPETDATKGLFDDARIGHLKRNALFVNFGRGSIIDEHALVAALERRQIGGAVIDVTMHEPLPADHPLWTAPNMILTQHTGGGTDDEIDRKIEFFADNLARYRTAVPLHNKVNIERGY